MIRASWDSASLPAPDRPGEGKKRCSFVLCALLTNQRHSSTDAVPGQPASQPPRILHILDPWESSFYLKKKKKSVFPPLGFRVAMLKGIFCALPEQVWIKAAASPWPTCPDLYYPSEVFAKKKENLKINICHLFTPASIVPQAQSLLLPHCIQRIMTSAVILMSYRTRYTL